jgi:hypothetical protein
MYLNKIQKVATPPRVTVVDQGVGKGPYTPRATAKRSASDPGPHDQHRTTKAPAGSREMLVNRKHSDVSKRVSEHTYGCSLIALLMRSRSTRDRRSW